MSYLQAAIDGLECLKRKLGRAYDKSHGLDLDVKDRYNYCENGIQRIMALDSNLTRKSKEHYLQ